MAITSDPAAVAMQQIVNRINAGSPGAYVLPGAATYISDVIEDLKCVSDSMEVTVVPDDDSDENLEGTLDYDNFSAHPLRVWFRKKITGKANATIEPLNLLVAQVADFIDQKATDTAAVSVMDVEIDWQNTPDKALLRQGIYSGAIKVLVEVES